MRRIFLSSCLLLSLEVSKNHYRKENISVGSSEQRRDLSILAYCRRELHPRGPWKVLDPALKINVETIYLFKLIFKFVYESYLLLNLRQIIN